MDATDHCPVCECKVHQIYMPHVTLAEDGLWTMAEIAKYLGIDRNTLRRWYEDGKIPIIFRPRGHRRRAIAWSHPLLIIPRLLIYASVQKKERLEKRRRRSPDR